MTRNVYVNAKVELEVGVLMRHTAVTPELSRDALTHMKVTIESARGVTEKVKRRTVVGLDRCTSRIGQAGHRALQMLNQPTNQQTGDSHVAI